MAADLSVWDGDGLPEEVEEVEDYLAGLGCLPCELDALYEGCKREGWIYEKLAKHERSQGQAAEADKSLAMSAYFWRRAQRWKEFAAAAREDE